MKEKREMKGNKLVKILTATLFAATVLTAIAPMEVKAEGHGEGCTGADIIWLGGDDNHFASCNGCNVIVSSHTPVAGGSIVKIDSRYHGKKCTVDGCNLAVARQEHSYVDDICTVCGYFGPHAGYNIKKYEERVGIIEEKKSEPVRDLSKEAFGGRAPEALSVEEQKTAVSYAIENLRASGNALPANTVKAGGANNGSSDIAAVVADNRDAVNQQAFAQAMCQNLGFTNVTPLKTYNMYALHATYDAKSNAQTVTWSNTGLKFGDTAFVVWYNQKLGKIELLPAVVGPTGDVAVSVPALGDVSTMTVVKANK